MNELKEMIDDIKSLLKQREENEKLVLRALGVNIE